MVTVLNIESKNREQIVNFQIVFEIHADIYNYFIRQIRID